MIVTQPIVLVVDDELFFRNLYCDLLAAEGYLVEVCEDGDNAIIRMQQGQVDLVLTDMVMPGKSGLEVLHSARLLPNPPEVILVTGYASVESAIQALKSGARDYLVKPFDPDELKHLVRNCLGQRRLLAENEHLKSQIQLFQTGQELASLIDLERFIPQALNALLRQIGAGSGFGFSLKAGGLTALVALNHLRDDQAESLIQLILPQIDKALGVMSLQKVLLSQVDASPFAVERLWILPLGDSRGLKGGLVIVDADDSLEQQIPHPDLRYLTEQIFLGFENACRFQAAQELMHTDDLTGLYNYRYMQVAMEHEIRRSQRYGLQFSLLFLDLDHFKEINDQHGHLSGSAALQEVSELLRQCMRDVDTLFRFGGDEFAAILVETDGHTARIVAERIRATIEDYVFLADKGTASRLTATIGFSTFPSDALDKDALLNLADKSMYVGKVIRNVVRGVENIP